MTDGSKELDIDQIAERTGISARGLRYVVDYDLLNAVVPWFRALHAKRRGIARTFPPYFAFLLCLAASLRTANLSREQLQTALQLLAEWLKLVTKGQDYAQRLYPLFDAADKLVLEIGDGEFLHAGRKSRTRSGLLPAGELPWTHLSAKQSAADGYVPLVVSRIDVAEIRRRLLP
ncbi:MAG: hypothetical protein ACLFVU_07315 [Phycisphaerae bacterium]